MNGISATGASSGTAPSTRRNHYDRGGYTITLKVFDDIGCRTGRVTVPVLIATCASACDHATVALDTTIRDRKVTLDTGTFRVAEGASAPITVTCPRRAARLLASSASLRAQASILLRSSTPAQEARRVTTFRLLEPR
jgi:hypothetical protein